MRVLDLDLCSIDLDTLDAYRLLDDGEIVSDDHPIWRHSAHRRQHSHLWLVRHGLALVNEAGHDSLTIAGRRALDAAEIPALPAFMAAGIEMHDVGAGQYIGKHVRGS